jgi:hypothetical protein
MSKFFFCLACFVSYASAAIIEGIVSEQPFYQNSVNITVFANGAPPHQPNGTVGFSYFSDQYSLTITGGTGQSSFVPCLFAGDTLIGSQGMSVATFGSDTLSSYPGVNGRTCSQLYDGLGTAVSLVPAAPIPFTYGVQQIFTITLQAMATEGQDQASLYGIDAYNGGTLGPAQFTMIELPEPATVWLLGAGLGGFLLARRRIRPTSAEF